MSDTIEKDTPRNLKTYHVNGMSCAACAQTIETTARKVQGINDANVNYAASTLFVDFDPDKTSYKEIRKSVRKAGYDIVENASEAKSQITFPKLLTALVLSTFIMIISMGWLSLAHSELILLLLTFPVLFYSGINFFKSAFKQTLIFKANMDTLIALGSGTAFVFSLVKTLNYYLTGAEIEGYVYFESAAMIVTFILVGKYIEERAKKRTGDAIEKLIELQPHEAIKIENGKEIKISIKEVKIGDTLLIRSGDRIPLDGLISSGHSYVDESMITGEFIPVEKFNGEKIYAGTVNKTGSFKMTVTVPEEETLLSKIIEMVRIAQGSKAPVQQLTDKISAVFVPSVLLISVLTLIYWWFFTENGSFQFALTPAISVLIIACPCALGLATPTAVIAGIGRGAKLGVLFKNAESLQTLGEINTLITDKTGTITNGEPEVFDFVWENNLTDPNFLKKLLFHVEKRTDHPLAFAVCKHLDLEYDEEFDSKIDHFEVVLARGIRCEYEGNLFLVGNNRFMQEEDVMISKAISQSARELRAQGKTLIYFAYEGMVVGIVSVYDAIRVGADEAIRKLSSLDIHVIMMTGDSQQAAEPLCHQLGIQELYYDVKPHQKQSKVKEIQDEGKKVAMTGDGINDAPALSQADVGIALGTGTDIAIQSATVTLVNGDLRKIAQALALSRATLSTIRTNLFLAFIYNIISIPIAAGLLYMFTGTFLNPMIAAAAMALSSISVVLNSLYLYNRNFI